MLSADHRVLPEQERAACHLATSTKMHRVQQDSCLVWQLTAPLSTLWRSDSTLQLGLEPPAGLLVQNPPEALPDVLQALIRPRRRNELDQVGGAGSQHWLDALLSMLAGAGLLRSTRPTSGAVSVIGEGRLAILVAELLLAELDEPVRLVWPGSAGTPRAALSLQARFPNRLLCFSHWSYSPSDPSGLVVIAAQAAEADRSLLAQLEADGQPYLVVRACDLGTSVGPLVAPGRTACQRCEDLHRAARDSAWPRLLAQLCRRRPAPGQAALYWAAATGVGQALAWLDGAVPDTLGAALELNGAGQVGLRPIRAHPGCGCLQFG